MKRQKNPVSLKKLNQDSRSSLDRSRFLLALKDSNDRACAIVGAAVVDDALRSCLLMHMIDDEQLDETLFNSESGPMSGFSAKINAAYALGLIGVQSHADMHCIRLVRNAFAHIKTDVDFNHSGIIRLCERIKIRSNHPSQDTDFYGNPIPRARLIFVTAVTEFGYRLNHEASGGKRPKVWPHLP
jgi:DNA-binding MltR family transcriptional regulator